MELGQEVGQKVREIGFGLVFKKIKNDDDDFEVNASWEFKVLNLAGLGDNFYDFFFFIQIYNSLHFGVRIEDRVPYSFASVCVVVYQGLNKLCDVF